MNDLSFLQRQIGELRRLLKTSVDDPILEPQLKNRLEAAERELREATTPIGSLFPAELAKLPRTAIFMRGDGAIGPDGIRPGLAGEVLIQYEKIYEEQAIHDERIAAAMGGRQRRPKGAPIPELLFIGTPRGSFGLEFTPQIKDNGELLEIHAGSLERIAATIMAVLQGNDFDATIEQTPARVLRPLKQFLTTLSNHGAELRLATSKLKSPSFTASEISDAVNRLSRDVSYSEIKVRGEFRGLTLDSGRFDLRKDDGLIVSGYVVDSLSEEDLERIHNLTNRKCEAEIEETVIRNIHGTEQRKFLLLNVRPVEEVKAS